MSRKGGQNGEKHGGAHISAHETRLGGRIPLSLDISVDNSFLDEPRADEHTPGIQDGDNGLADNDKANSSPDTLHYLSSDSDDLDSYERAVVENNTEWLKSRCRNLDAVEFDISNHGGHVDALDLTAKVKDIGELFDGEHLAGTDSVLYTARSGDVSVMAPPPPGPPPPPPPPSSSPSSSSSSSPSSSSLDGSSLAQLMLPPGQDRESEKPGSELGIEVSLLGFNNVDTDKSNTLMTPQELESMPDRGIEFEESVGPKQQSTTGARPSEGGEKNAVTIKQESTPIAAATGGEQATVDAPSPLQNISVTSAFVDSVVVNGSSPEGLIGQGNLALATISISTDHSTNSTQIVVNTTQGQQLYHINTADLTQATHALQPLAQTTTTTTTSSSSSSSSTTSPTQPSSAAPGQTGYLLLPVAQGEGSSCVLMTDPLSSNSSLKQEESNEQINSGLCKKLWPCSEPGCEKVFKKLSKLKIHLMRHTGERPFKCLHPSCDWAFTTAYKLKRHVESHEGRKDFVCDIDGCGRKFTTIYNLNSHKKLHERPCNEVCPKPSCGLRFPTKRQLDLHLKNHTDVEKTYKCPVEGCDKVFFSRNCMGSHARVHQQDREDLVCKFEGCGKVFNKVCRLKQHTRSHTGEKPYKCRFEGCAWAFTTASKLKRHMSKHTGVRKWLCNSCGKAFMRAEHLKGHMVTHSGAKPFQCLVEGCDTRFTAKSSLYIHLKKHDHSGERIIYHCPMEGCEIKYSTKASLRNHIMKHYSQTLSAADNTRFDLVPLLSGEDLPDSPSLEVLTSQQTQGGGEDASSVPVSGVSIANTLSNTIMGTTDPVLISPADYITGAGESPLISVASATPSLSSHHINQNVMSQLIASAELPHHLDPVTSNGLSSNHRQKPKITIASGILGKSLQENSAESRKSDYHSVTSARTDYYNNHLLIDRFRKKRRLRDKSGTELSYHVVSESKKMLTVPVSASPVYAPADSLPSHGITLRDPETGVTYVQTQLLQDDPPNPEIYPTEADLGSDLSSLHDASGDVSSTEFTGTTINLQDLE